MGQRERFVKMLEEELGVYEVFKSWHNGIDYTVEDIADNLIAKGVRLEERREVGHTEFTKDQLTQMMENLVNSSEIANRVAAAEQGYGLERLVHDEAFQVRLAVADQEYGNEILEILAHDPEPAVRRRLAKRGLALDILSRDKNDHVRGQIAEEGYMLDQLVHDESSLVRWLVATNGYGFDLLSKDKDKNVRKEVNDCLKRMGLSVEEWVIANPDKCALPENQKVRLDDAIKDAEMKKGTGSRENCSKVKDTSIDRYK